MTKKDYIIIASLLKKHKTMTNLRQEGISHIVKSGPFMLDLCDYLKKDNTRFDEIKFREASGEILAK
tara:strand:- start:425 stop:625 length:201 start_codon:yes stop_codon:yes gene_type:complete